MAENNPPFLAATGVVRRKVKTSLAAIKFGILGHAERAHDVEPMILNAMSSLTEFLSTSGVAQVEESGLTIEPEMDIAADQRHVLRYKGHSTVTCEVVTERSADLMRGAIEAGARNVQHVSFKATEEQIVDARLSAIEKAVQTATREARAASRAAGSSIGEIIQIQIADSLDEYRTGDGEVLASVTIKFQLR